MACKHFWDIYGDVRVCSKCGLTKLPNGCMFFDRDYLKVAKKGVNYREKQVTGVPRFLGGTGGFTQKRPY